ncbi:uncharacterized protein [Haliotis asinina]|uniref:uncharacterized protein n=1 Tax=Haliotis asinina TaxID=109174 RepID=UPI0035326A77
MTFNNLHFHVGIFFFTFVSFCHTKQCFLEKHPCINEFKLWTLDENRQGFVEISLPAQPLTISQYSVTLMSNTSTYDVQLSEDPHRNRKYAICNIALGEDVDDHQPWAIVLLERGTVIDGVIYSFNYSDSRAQALAKDNGLNDYGLVDNKSLSLSWCGSSYVQSFPTMWEDNACSPYIDVFTVDDSFGEVEDEPGDELDDAASPAKNRPELQASDSTGMTSDETITSAMPEPSSTTTTSVVRNRSTRPSVRQHTSTSPQTSASTKPPSSQSPSASINPTSPRSSSSTKQPASPSSSASTKSKSTRTSASPKLPTSSSSHSSNGTEQGPTGTSRTKVSSSPPASTSSVSVTASLPPTSSTVAPFLKNPVINEVSILVRNDVNNSFIELRGPNMTLDNFSLVVFDGKSTETLFHKRFGKHDVISGSGIFVVHYFLKRNHTANDSSVAVALYDNSKWFQHYTEHVPINQIRGLLDSFIVRTTEEDIHADILENLVPQSTNRIFTVNPGLVSGRSHVSISRCGDDIKDPGSFILAPSTIGRSNNCTTGYGNRVQFKLTDANCQDFRSNKALQQSLIDVIVNSVNDKCKCGLSQVLVKERQYICGSLIFEAYLESSFPWQSHLIFQGFRNFVHTSNTVIVGPRSYNTDSSCFQDCLPPATKPGSDNDDNVTLTVAVVVSCVGVFLIIAMSVIIYIRRKKRGIVTFRLTNLGELDTSGILHEDKDDIIDEDNATFRTISIVS